jgi:hypothetical protein
VVKTREVQVEPAVPNSVIDMLLDFRETPGKKKQPQIQTRTHTRREKKMHGAKSNKNASSDRANCSHKWGETAKLAWSWNRRSDLRRARKQRKPKATGDERSRVNDTWLKITPLVKRTKRESNLRTFQRIPRQIQNRFRQVGETISRNS